MGSFQIVPIGSTSLKIVDPPTYWVVVLLALPFLFSLLAFGGSMMARLRPSERAVSFQGQRRTVRQLGRGWLTPVVSAVFTVCTGYGIWCLLQTSTLVIDRQAGTYTIDKGRPFFIPFVETGSLDNVAKAALDTGDGTFHFVLVLQDGKRIGLGSYTDQGRQSEAVSAVNHFLQSGAE